jgi:integrase
MTSPPPFILNNILRPVEDSGAVYSAHRLMEVLGQILMFRVASGLAERDGTQDLAGALVPFVVKHRATVVDKKKVALLMANIRNYPGSPVVAYALRVLPYFFVRPGELRHAEWEEIDLGERIRRIPAGKMKTRSPHLVPLSAQVAGWMGELKENTGKGKYLFPGARANDRPMSDVAVLAALRYLGYGRKEICAHGFRAMASTMLNEMGYNPDWVERQLAHSELNGVRAAYNHAEHLPERRKMTQEWADFLDSLLG